MPSDHFAPAMKPTMHFIGVTTRQSSINAIFPRWAEWLGLGDCELRGVDFPLHAPAEQYRTALEFIKHDPLTRGALVTTHKIDVCAACRDQFDALDPLAAALGEVSSIYKRAGRLHARAVDPWTVGYALDAFLPREHWRDGAEVLILGAGGSGSALAWHLTHGANGVTRPARIHVADRSPSRLAHLQRLHATWPNAVPLACHEVTEPRAADLLLAQLPPASLVVNATGAGKDTPGSPLSDAAVFPERGLVWEFNYRGQLVFLEQARAQQHARRLRIEDGWVYFLHGWTQIIADVFDCEIPPHGALFDDLARIAAQAKRL
jgi:shikimate 5-dehydrogenase